MIDTEIVTIVLAQPGGEDPPVQGPGFGKASPFGLFLLLALLVAVVFLVRSMNSRLKKMPTRFDQDKADSATPARVRRAELARQRAGDSGMTEEPEKSGESKPAEDAEASETEESAETASGEGTSTERAPRKKASGE